MSNTISRYGRIDLLRGVSILLVLFHHFNIAYRLNDTSLSTAFGWNAVRAIARNGNYGVTMFFTISGFLITSNAMRRWSGLANVDVKAFYALRVARIVPCLLLLLAIVDIAALAGIAIFQNHAPEGVPVSLWRVNLASLTFWMNVLIGKYGWVNYALGVLWSLSVEEVFYLSFPLLCAVLRRESWLLACWAVVAVVGPLYRFTHQGDEGGFLYAYFACFDGVAIGCSAAVLAKRFALRARLACVLQIIAVAAMAFVYLNGPIAETNIFGVTATALGTAVLLMTIVTADPKTSPQRDSARRGFGLEWFGRHSYELYLFHLIVLGALRTLWPSRAVAGDEKLLLLLAFFVLSALLSAGIARFFSEPLNGRIRAKLRVT